MKLVVILRYEVLVLAAVALWGCGEATCPAGSEEVGGKCKKMGAAEHGDKDAMTPEASEGGGDADAGGLRDATTPPMKHADAAANGEDEPDAARHDDGGSDDAGSDAETAEPACEPGFVLGDSECARDRCLATDDEPAACGEHGQCSEGTRSKPSCACDEGYVDEDAQCVRNPCIALDDEPAACDPNAECSYEGEGEASCECNDGYEGDGTTCERNACIRLSGEDPPCAANQVCMPTEPGEKSCECAEHFADCDGEQETGCEIDLTNNPENCGECEYACASGLECGSGVCAERVIAMAGGSSNTCALNPDHEVLCWGSGGLLYGNDIVASNIPIALDIGLGKSISVGNQAACMLNQGESSVTCWGPSNENYQLGGTDTSATKQTFVLAAPRSVATEGTYGCAANDIGQVFCWGNTDFGHMGDGRPYDASSPYRAYTERYPVESVIGAVEVSTSQHTACARTGSGGVRCWGTGFAYGGPTPALYAPTEVRHSGPGTPVVNDAVSVCTGVYHGCAVLTDGSVVCWGNNLSGVYGNGSVAAFESKVDFESVATQVLAASGSEPLQEVTKVACGNAHNCALLSTGGVYCWGANEHGQVGLTPSATPVSRPTLVEGIDGDIVDVAAGSVHTCARTMDGRVYCWGSDSEGQLGIGITQSSPISTPTELTYWP